LAGTLRSLRQRSMWPLHRKDTKLTKVRFAKALGTLLLLFAAAYGPAFLTVALLKLRPFEAVPVIIVISLAVAILLIDVVSRRAGGFAQFGFRFCHYRYTAAAIVFGVPIAWALTILVNHLSSAPPPPEVSFRPWMTFLYFVVGAAIQEEIIFRGLLQTTLARQFPAMLSFFGTSLSYAAIIVALLFGLIHLEVNPITAAAAFVLGLLSGELRHRSGSLLPAILVHAVFNAFAAIL
jgi:membrane protease YdiL (CAAX protease family)